MMHQALCLFSLVSCLSEDLVHVLTYIRTAVLLSVQRVNILDTIRHFLAKVTFILLFQKADDAHHILL